MEKNWFRRIMYRKTTTKQCDIHDVSGSIWLLYRIEDGELKTYGYYTDYVRAVLWSESGKYSIVECKTWG